jgi:hypothetical protein
MIFDRRVPPTSRAEARETASRAGWRAARGERQQDVAA